MPARALTPRSIGGAMRRSDGPVKRGTHSGLVALVLPCFFLPFLTFGSCSGKETGWL
jgi:hypothetical protein